MSIDLPPLDEDLELRGLLAERARDADLGVLKARLEGLAIDAAAAQKSLEHAYALNPW